MKIPKNFAHLAVEVTSRRLLDMKEGETNTVNIEKAQEAPATERAALENFFEEASAQVGLNDVPGVQYEELDAVRNQLHQELRDVDLDGDGISQVERAQMSQAGQVAMELAEAMMAQEPVAAMTAQVLDGLDATETLQVIKQAALDHVDLGYGVARAVMFSYLDNQQGQVQDVYAGQSVEATGIPSSMVMNTEHTWPKSRGVKQTSALSDLHHLYPTERNANTRRASYPFGEVGKVIWEDGHSKLGVDDKGNVVFEPPPEHRGNIARALFYVASVYDLPFLEGEPEVLLQWHKQDPVDTNEQTRNENISRFQRNRNPFVDNPQLVEKVFSQLSTQPVPEHMRYNESA